jgi:sec-independent protein translocase protein TatA
MLRDLSFVHILILLVIVLLVFGARRLPEIGSSLGKGIKEFQKSLKEIGDSATSERTTLPPSMPRQQQQQQQRPAEPDESGEPKRLSD